MVRMRTIIFNNVLPFGGGRKIDIFHCQVCSPVRERITILDVGGCDGISHAFAH